MPSMSEIIERTPLTDHDHRWLRLLVSEWQLLADLSFSDLVLWVPDADENVYWAAAQIRPFTGPTALLDDVVGDMIAYSPEHLVSDAFVSGGTTRTSDNKLQAGMPAEEARSQAGSRNRPVWSTFAIEGRLMAPGMCPATGSIGSLSPE